jgi:hypothetical protein
MQKKTKDVTIAREYPSQALYLEMKSTKRKKRVYRPYLEILHLRVLTNNDMASADKRQAGSAENRQE